VRNLAGKEHVRRRLAATQQRELLLASRPAAKPHASIVYRSRPSNFLFIPFVAVLYATIIAPMLLIGCEIRDAQCLAEPPDKKLFWPVIACISLAIAIRRLSRVKIPSNISWLFACLSLAGLSIIWSRQTSSIGAGQ
jgi:hypothetical protein